MLLADVECSLDSVLRSNRIGTPVALRIYALLPDFRGDLRNAIGCFAPLIQRVSNVSAGKLLARAHPGGKQVSVLWMDAEGRSAFISVTSVPKAPQSLRVLLAGNHGVMQLSGGELWNEPVSGEESPLWSEEITKSLKTGTSIPVGLS